MPKGPQGQKRPADVIGNAVKVMRESSPAGNIDAEADLRYASGEGRLPEAVHFAECDGIFGAMRVGSVHEGSYGHNWEWTAA